MDRWVEFIEGADRLCPGSFEHGFSDMRLFAG